MVVSFVCSVMPAAHASTPKFGVFIDPYPSYEGQTKCDPAPKPGVLAFQAIVMAKEPGTSIGSISRDCSIGGQSEHKEGRAWDWSAAATVPTQRKAAYRIISWLEAPDRYGNDAALARRFGIMYLIYERRIWFPGGGWRTYCVEKAAGCVSPGTKTDLRDPHTSHVHFSFTWDGALKKTSYWNPKSSYASSIASAPWDGYWATGATGSLAAGNAPYLGSVDGSEHPIVAMASTPTGGGYWFVTNVGRVRAFGDAPFRGQRKGTGGRIADIAPTPSGKGYWLVSKTGRVFSFGDADSQGGLHDEDSGAVIALIPTATGLGYSIVTSDGITHPFGDAVATSGADPGTDGFVAAAPSAAGGYWLATSGGRVVSIGGAPELRDLSAKSLAFPVVDIAGTATGQGYFLLLQSGKVLTSGDAPHVSTQTVTTTLRARQARPRLVDLPSD